MSNLRKSRNKTNGMISPERVLNDDQKGMFSTSSQKLGLHHGVNLQVKYFHLWHNLKPASTDVHNTLPTKESK